MPARSSIAPWRFPERLSLLLRLPENEIERILFFVTSYFYITVPTFEVVNILVRELSISSEASGLILDSSI